MSSIGRRRRRPRKPPLCEVENYFPRPQWTGGIELCPVLGHQCRWSCSLVVQFILLLRLLVTEAVYKLLKLL